MDNYIGQLIQDLRNAKKHIPRTPNYETRPELEGLQGILEWENEPARKMSRLFGIDKDVFPPSGKLTPDQTETLAVEIEALWQAFNFYPDFPENLPARYRYEAMLSRWDEDVQYISQGQSHLEFCHYEPAECPFPEEFCMCKDCAFDEREEAVQPYTNNEETVAELTKELEELSNRKHPPYVPWNKLTRYIEQVVEDLENATGKVKRTDYFLQDGGIMTLKVASELKNNPYQSLEELSGIQRTAFPLLPDLDGIQTRMLLRAMLQLTNAYNMEILYPDDLPFDMKYEVLSENWDNPCVQHLPTAGMDVDFCTGNPNTCPFGEYCYCGNDDIDPEDEPPAGREGDDRDFEVPF